MTQAFNLSQLANNLNTAGQLDATDGLVNAVPVANGGTGASTDSAARTNLDVPSRTGSNASGTWGISITGNAATATIASGLTSGVAVANLGYTPVQQGTGVGQTGNAIKIGFSAQNKIKATVDSTDFGYFLTGPSVPANNFSSNGYERLPSGLIMQWGNTGSMSGGQNLTVTYPIAFSNSVFNIQTTVIVSTDTNEIVHVYNVSTSTFVAANSNPGSLDGVYWLAFGY
jgi:hypothetical protein